VARLTKAAGLVARVKRRQLPVDVGVVWARDGSKRARAAVCCRAA